MFSTRLRPIASLVLWNKSSSALISILHNPSLQYRNVASKAHAFSECPPPHSLLPNLMLWRSLLIATVSAHRILLNPALWLLSILSKPRRGVLDVKKNLLLRGVLKWTVYNHFCAGENSDEVKSTISRIKSMGFKGVILTYAAEVVVDRTAEIKTGTEVVQMTKGGSQAVVPADIFHDPAIESWKNGVLDTVRMIGSGDYLALKFTGASPAVAQALETGQPIPPQMTEALDDICQEAIKRNACVLVDAEQHFVQEGIDRIALHLMCRYNRGQKAVIYNTYQAYLKRTPQVLLEHLRQAQEENIIMGVKLVRGAYINSEPRNLINDTKEDTDNAYDMIARYILQQKYPSSENINQPFPRIQLFLATHNLTSVLKAYEIQQEQSTGDFSSVPVHYGQLLGMADEVSCTLLQLKEKAANGGIVVPEAYKCLSWGTLDECISYLLRRAVENRDAVTRTKQEYMALKQEAIRRIIGGGKLF